jgi:hypothetical protein
VSDIKTNECAELRNLEQKLRDLNRDLREAIEDGDDEKALLKQAGIADAQAEEQQIKRKYEVKRQKLSWTDGSSASSR